MTLDLATQLIRIGLGTLLGAAIGWERERSGQPAGMRTHALVACGATMFTLVGAYGLGTHAGDVSYDPSRVSAQIVSGIGFIGAGAIIKDGASVRGVTTAAALWTSAALGMAAGAGVYGVALGGTITVLATLVGLRALRERGSLPAIAAQHLIHITYERGHGTLGPLLQAVEDGHGTLQGLEIADDEEHRTVHMRVRAASREALREGIEDVGRKRPEVVAVAFATPGAQRP